MIESVREDLSADDEHTVQRALIAVQMFRLPLAAEVQPLFDSEFEGLALHAFLAAGGEEEVLFKRLLLAKSKQNEKEQYFAAMALLDSDQNRELALRTLATLALNSDIDEAPREVFKALGGQLSSLGIHALLSELSEEKERDVAFHFTLTELFPLSVHLREQHWPGIRLLFESRNDNTRYLAAIWAITGDFDNLDPAELLGMLRQDDPVQQAVAATLLVRQNHDDMVAGNELSRLLDSAHRDARRVAMWGVSTLSEDRANWLSQILPMLYDEEEDARREAGSVVERFVDDQSTSIAQFLIAHVEDIPATILRNVLIAIRSNESGMESDVPFALWTTMARHRDSEVREQAMTGLRLEGPQPDVLEMLFEGVDDSAVDVQDAALRTLMVLRLPEAALPQVETRVKPLLRPEKRSSLRVQAAALLWRNNLEQAAILQFQEQLLKSQSRHDVNDGLELIKTLRQSAIPNLPLAFDHACGVWMYRERLHHAIGFLGPAGRDFLRQRLMSQDVQQRGTALLLLHYSHPEVQTYEICTKLLDDTSMFTIHNGFGRTEKAINEVAADLVTYWARTDSRILTLLQMDEAQHEKLKVLVPPSERTWLENPVSVDSLPDEPTFWQVRSYLGELKAVGGFAVRKTDSAGRADTDLLLEFLRLSDRCSVSRFDGMSSTPGYIFEDLSDKEVVDERLVDEAMHWLTDVSLLSPYDRESAATMVLRFRPNNVAAKSYLELGKRALTTWDF
ncbi:MAG: hypothetical protein H6824_08315 [Planctomycetaceae bacterium]|nr:hypothetical protein [Planctomycetaceae bacterium]